ncbi:MAG: helix-turn-helix domain-containing protein, partial [Gemmatimonadales bacterium]|nr:helix-turn-helix domain-containing protein [Gemmatimonadales bacterium]NIN11953.1 helix-turn-helix domain-containing protein [Gemmatimonadales bacterium]NIR03242.1 helix-turn-helix domain-containing protein [Gemmatimonadales bacterium]NIS66928.1 helix-turn-helix domain-containing protein [Gemmatimonadales bacterium]
SPKRLEPDALELLARHRWPGNVRELQTLMERLELFAEGPTVSAAAVLAHLPVNSANRHERATLTMALEAHGWDVRQTARALGIARSTLYRWLKQHGLERPVPTSSPVSRETEGASHATRAPSPAAP